MAVGEDGGSEEPETVSVGRELAWMVGGAYVLVLTITLAGSALPLVGRYVHLLVAAVFIGLPYWCLERNDWSFQRFGLRSEHFWRDVGWGLVATGLTLVPFAGGYWVWATQVLDRTYAFDVSNFQRWAPELEGEPSGWGERDGVWIWTEGRALHVGLGAGEGRSTVVELETDRPVRPVARGGAEVEPVPGDAGVDGSEWQIQLRDAPRGRAVLAPPETGTGEFPTEVEVSLEKGGSERIRTGPGAERTGERTYEAGRGLRWIYLWLLTHLFFIALPEEYFYRGYLQTRVGDAIERWRGSSERDDAETEERSWWGVSESNLAASAIFGVAHLFTPVGGRLLWNRIGVAVPAVGFGWLRERTDSITAGVVYHAGCNMMVLLAEPHFF